MVVEIALLFCTSLVLRVESEGSDEHRSGEGEEEVSSGQGATDIGVKGSRGTYFFCE